MLICKKIQPPEVVSRYRDPQPQVVQNYTSTNYSIEIFTHLKLFWQTFANIDVKQSLYSQ